MRVHLVQYQAGEHRSQGMQIIDARHHDVSSNLAGYLGKEGHSCLHCRAHRESNLMMRISSDEARGVDIRKRHGSMVGRLGVLQLRADAAKQYLKLLASGSGARSERPLQQHMMFQTHRVHCVWR